MKMIQNDRVRSFRFWNKATPMTVKSRTVSQMVKSPEPIKISTLVTAMSDTKNVPSMVEWDNN